MRPSDRLVKSCSHPSAGSDERRSHGRYALELELDCRLAGSEECLPGKTSDLSSTGVRFYTGRDFPVGETVTLRIQWPTPDPEALQLELVLDGRVVRSDENGTAVRMLRYRFGTPMTGTRDSRTVQANALVA